MPVFEWLGAARTFQQVGCMYLIIVPRACGRNIGQLWTVWREDPVVCLKLLVIRIKKHSSRRTMLAHCLAICTS